MAGSDSISKSLRLPYRAVLLGGGVLIILVALGLRLALFRIKSPDYEVYLSQWYAYLQAHGFGGFKHNFSNYNLPYLYLLYFLQLLHIPALIAIKGLSVIFDFVLALGIYLNIKQLNGNKTLASLGAAVTLFLPTVFLNSAAWGQCDSIYAAFLLFSFYAVQRRQPLWAWIFWAIALDFKLQAIFFLPFLVLYWLARKEGKWYVPAVAVPVFFLPFVPAMLAGRSFSSIVSIYTTQSHESTLLTLNAPNIYQWLGDNYAHYLNTAGMLLAGGAVLLLLLAIIVLRLYHRPAQLAVIALAVLALLPFLLPRMHERYFYPAEIFSLLVAFAIPRLWFVALGFQLTGLFVYIPYLFGIAPPVPVKIVALLQLVLVIIVTRQVFLQVRPSTASA